MSRKNIPGAATPTVHRFVLTVAAPSKTTAEDLRAVLELIFRAGLTDLAESLKLPDEDQWGTELAAELGDIKLEPLTETP